MDTPHDGSADAGQGERLTLAGGCFWCTEAVFTEIDGVLEVVSGYANGHVDHPSYEAVCTGRTGHAEAVRLRYDPARVALEDLLAVFFATHDPTTLDRQGHDAGPQYRSAIYWESPAQLPAIASVLGELQGALRAAGAQPAVTELQPLRAWWPAEAMHQRYFEQHPYQGYCAAVVAPKVDKFRRHFDRLRRRPG